MNSPEKIDLYKQCKADYAATKKPRLVELKPATYLAISGQGAPGGPVFSTKIGALYAMAYTIKMTRKFNGRQDYVIGKLEAQWWTPDVSHCLAQTSREQWCWKLLIRTPDFVTQTELDQAAAVLHKKGKTPEAIEVHLENITEGLCAQMLHVGPYDKEGDTLAIMNDFAALQGVVFSGHHHEVYLSDPRRVPPEKLKTILRHPVTTKNN
jgi:hypothetical protein